jgi:hypothetical protein
MRSFRDRLAALERLEAEQRPTVLPYVCLHPVDYAALSDLATPVEAITALASAYGLVGDRQKIYVGVCLCWDDGSCPVCSDAPIVALK